MSHPTLDLKRAYLALRRALDQTVKPFHFTASQFDVLQLLLHEDGIEHRDLQRRLNVTSPTLTNVLDVLERNGHIIRRADAADARLKTIHLSGAARSLCASPAFCNAGDALVAQMFQGFTGNERRDFLRYLKRVEMNLEEGAGS